MKITLESNGFILKGNLEVPEENSPSIVMLHGFTADKDLEFWREIASNFFERGFNCLRFNFRGCGERKEKSQGKFENTTLTSRIKDYKSALNFIENSSKVNSSKIGVLGHSLGGMVAISGKDERVDSIVTLGTPYKVPRYDEPELPEKVGDYYLMPSGVKFKKEFYEDIKRYDMGRDIQKAPPIRVIHGTSDEIVPIDHAEKLHEKAREPKSLKIVSNANHLFSDEKPLKEAVDLAVDWFKNFLN